MSKNSACHCQVQAMENMHIPAPEVMNIHERPKISQPLSEKAHRVPTGTLRPNSE